MKRKHAQPLQHKQFAFKAKAVNDDGTFSGYGSVFGNVDSYREIVAPGAFAKSLLELKQIGDPLPALWQHNSDEPIGGYPIEDMAEDDHGLAVSGFLMINEVPLAKQAHALMKKRIVKGLSIGYYIRDDSFDEKTGVRTLKELELVEISIVTFPANAEATIDAVKAALVAGKLPTLPEFERHLREAGFSKTQATAIANGGLSKLLRSESGDAKANDMVRKALAALS
jgi:HK97 family phage prohead protease